MKLDKFGLKIQNKETGFDYSLDDYLLLVLTVPWEGGVSVLFLGFFLCPDAEGGPQGDTHTHANGEAVQRQTDGNSQDNSQQHA